MMYNSSLKYLLSSVMVLCMVIHRAEAQNSTLQVNVSTIAPNISVGNTTMTPQSIIVSSPATSTVVLSTSAIMPTAATSSPVPSASLVNSTTPNNNTADPKDDPVTKATMYLLIACVGLFVIIILVLIILVIQMRNLSKKIKK